ncbi:MAG TPA: tRNA (adenosine(37)-N6)-dimethylallyltransferase MiaA [Candidatus Paceibacterota bacterium]|nr:tRNA (adenosine(37)-N6)-dimethylallyltransferase MiaA [Candidatus Paceibacterota bacterium]
MQKSNSQTSKNSINSSNQNCLPAQRAGRLQKPKIVVVLGPNASGKSDLAVAIAKKFNGEIISADSRQVYKGMDIGTGKVPNENSKIKNQKSKIKAKNYYYQGIRHHLIDVCSPKKNFTVVEYQRLAQQAIRDILKRKKLPIICGGTGFYIDAVLYDYQFPPVKPNSQLRKKLEKLSAEELFAKLQKLDSQYAEKIDPHNKRRLIRAIEVISILKKPMPPLIKSPRYDALKIGVYRPPQELKKRIEKRLTQRLNEGMVEEVKKLHQQGISWKRLYNFGLEYRYISLYLQNKISYEEMVNQLKRKIWQYARRQMIWFKKDKEIHWISSPSQALKLVRQFLQN